MINNIHYPEKAEQGFSGRDKNCKGKKYLFPLYSLSFILPIADGVYMSITRKNLAFMLHPILSLYIVLYIIYQYIRKILGIPPKLKTYDGRKTIG